MKSNTRIYLHLLAVIIFGTQACTVTNQGRLTYNSTNSSSFAEGASDSYENLDYMVDTWSSAITRDEVKKITSIMDFWSDESKSRYKLEGFRDIWVVNLKDYPDWQLDVNKIDPIYKAISPTTEYTSDQLAVVANADYSDHLRFSAIFDRTDLKTGKAEKDALISQSFSLVPDEQARYRGGMEAVVNYLKKASRKEVKHVKRDDVGRCRIFFNVSESGSITDVKLIESSNYVDVDAALIEIVKDMPRKWKPAQTKEGEKVAQEFVFTFGRAGC